MIILHHQEAYKTFCLAFLEETQQLDDYSINQNKKSTSRVIENSESGQLELFFRFLDQFDELVKKEICVHWSP